MSVARVPDSHRLQSIFVIVEYIRLSCQLSYFTVTSLPRACALTWTNAGIDRARLAEKSARKDEKTLFWPPPISLVWLPNKTKIEITNNQLIDSIHTVKQQV